ncbi:MAG: SUMF1/EgtB/PvdO family nonheme iron enzyme [Bryobacterales bacterium]|nr:SUMF1/EgtB/PvdO family nonheme iron enzyme [Bryobacterales bacterium]
MNRVSVLLTLVGVAGLAPAVEPAHQWTGFRGTGDSHTGAKLPVSWSDRHNIAWKTATPGFGQSTPVAARGRVYLTAVEGAKKEQLLVISLNAKTGKEIWRRSFASSRPQEAGDRVARAAPTPALDAHALYAQFDSGDLVALGHDGKVLWRKNFNSEYGAIQNGHDFGSSLRQSADTLYAFVNHVGPSYLIAIAKKGGATKWKVDLPSEGGWNTPLLAQTSGKDVLLVQRKGGVAAHDPETGAMLWEDLREFSRESAIPSLSVMGKTAVVPSNGKGGTWAFRLDAPKEILWRAKAATNAYSSPLLTEKRAYFVNAVGALFVVDLQTGRDLWTTRLPATTWASALYSHGRVYFFAGDGTTVVFRDANTLEKLAENRLEANSIVYAATPLENGLLLRTGSTLWKVAELGEADPSPELSRRTAPEAKVETPLPPAPEGKPGDVRVNAADDLKMLWVPSGQFRMGCSEGDAACEKDESPAHTVKLSGGFWLGATEVTVGAYKKFAAATGKALPSEPMLFQTKLNPGWGSGQLPMVRVSHADAQAYCRWAGGRLPTEAEWEYAARAGAAGAQYGAIEEVAWFGDNSGREPVDAARMAREQRGAYMQVLEKNGNRPQVVGGKKPNAWGFFDVLGNVAEWTADWHDLYGAEEIVAPKGPADGEKRVARGGAWTFPASSIRLSARLKLSADGSNDFTGFRCAQ